MVNREELKYWVSFSGVPGIGKAKVYHLLECFGSLRDAWTAPEKDLKRAGLDSRSLQALIAIRATLSPDAELDRLEDQHINAFTCEDSDYPASLKQIYDYPPVLFVKGDLPKTAEPCLAVVGTRRPTAYGRQAAGELVADLVRSGVHIVSGLARGIDSVAHQSALDAGGTTVAVFASGLDIVYPRENARLAASITEHGALISEHPLGTRPKPESFPLRNRIMSGISLGVLVIEAGERSGALITAHQALEQNREVLAVPGSIFSPASNGTNRLILEGAKLVRQCEDVIEELNLGAVTQQLPLTMPSPSNDTESAILRHLSNEPTHIDEICRGSGLPMSELSSALAMMELKGIARQLGGMNYVLGKGNKAE